MPCGWSRRALEQRPSDLTVVWKLLALSCMPYLREEVLLIKLELASSDMSRRMQL